ncbi:MAG: PKD domain-containing protein [Bacteroidota bacterium]|nr:PKD domain-containing protein [Bacteroidota bacterium]MDP3144626.1 PKD domain-containing protein [Bacteroidota bacterium]MDP3556565.1 PKD domain-containing protein [Bacteroidota bacterium]
MVKKILLIVFFSLFIIKSNAQLDTSFWFVAPDISATMGESPIELHIQTHSQAATVYVRQPANIPTGVNLTLSIPANTINVSNLTASITAVESSPSNTVSNKGIYISSNSNISVYYTIGSGANKEMISLKGQRAKGTDFYTPFPNTILTATLADGGVGFDVVATQTGVTTILITPRAACVGRAKNVTFARTLTQGQTFSMKDNNAVNPSELAGSIISADQPIAVTIGGSIRTSTALCPSYFADQITTSSNLGKEHVIMKGSGTSDVAYILATVNSTSLTITTGTGTINWLINTGETYSVNIASLTYIATDKPVYITQVSGYGCKLSGAQVAPAYCAGSYTTAFTRLSSDSLNLNIVTRTGFQNTFTLTSNGSPVAISPASFTTVPGSVGNLVAARIYFPIASIPVGSHNVLKNQNDIFGLGVHNGGTIGGSAYAYASEFGANPFVIASSVPTATICSNTSITLNGQIGGGPINGIWTLNGFGTLSGGPNQIINNIYTPNQIDTSLAITPTPTPPVSGGLVKFVLTSTGICPNKSDTFRVYVKQQPIVTAGTNSIICSNSPTVNLGGNVFGASTQGVWSVQAPGNGTFTPSVNTFSPSYFLSNTDTALNQLKFVLTSTNNGLCNAVSNTVTVLINHAPIVKASSVNPILKCANNSTVFLNGTVSGTTTSTGMWSTTGSGIFVPNQFALLCNYIPSNADILAGNIWLKLVSTNNLQCKAVADSVNVIFTQPVTVSAGVDLNSCKNNPTVPLNVVITGTASTTGIWYGGAGTFTSTNTSLTPTYIATPGETAAGFVILTFSTTNNGICIGVSDQVKIDFRDKPTANFIVNTVCLNNTTVFTDQSVNTSGIGSLNTWQWQMGDGGTSSAVNPIYTYTAAGNYTTQLVVSNTFNCYDTIYRPVTVYALPTASMLISRSCTGSAQLISFTDMSSIPAPASIPATGYYWDFGGFGFSYSKDTSLVFPAEGIYNITHEITSNNGCKSTITQSVNITPRPIAKFLYINNSALSLGANIAFIDSSKSAVSWSWDFGNGLTSNLQNPTTNYLSNGTYTVSLTVTDQFGCTSSYSAIVKISNIAAEITQLIPNMITPNNDGKNDVWRLDFINVFYKTAEINIYNRWGDLLFSSIGYSNAWDGTYKESGNPLPVGVYFYTINLNDPSDTKIYKGTVTILK